MQRNNENVLMIIPVLWEEAPTILPFKQVDDKFDLSVAILSSKYFMCSSVKFFFFLKAFLFKKQQISLGLTCMTKFNIYEQRVNG